jgi:hypothetical protein
LQCNDRALNFDSSEACGFPPLAPAFFFSIQVADMIAYNHPIFLFFYLGN